MDLAGHEKYLKTTVFGLTGSCRVSWVGLFSNALCIFPGNYPDYTMMIVGSNMGVVGMTKEHYQLTLALKIPVFMVVSKVCLFVCLSVCLSVFSSLVSCLQTPLLSVSFWPFA